jgi:hypothetical protein
MITEIMKYEDDEIRIRLYACGENHPDCDAPVSVIVPDMHKALTSAARHVQENTGRAAMTSFEHGETVTGSTYIEFIVTAHPFEPHTGAYYA